MIFTSDNAVGAAPEILAALGDALGGAVPAYGNDPLTEAAEARVRAVFEAPEARVYLVSTGTAANALALGCLSPPWGAVFTSKDAHIEVDECGAPVFFTGGSTLSLVDGAHAKIAPEALGRAVAARPAGDVHSHQNAAVSITQATELGAAYSAEEIAALAALAHDAGMRLHIDGARFANAVARAGCTPAEMSWKAGVDVLCLGATKNGALAAEAVILFDPGLAWEFELRRKRAGHLFSKMRVLSAQIDAYLADGLWLRLASHANAMADRLAAALEADPRARVTSPVGANMVFAEITYAQHRALQAAGARYYPWPRAQALNGPDHATLGIRMVCSFLTAEAEIDGFAAVLGDA